MKSAVSLIGRERIRQISDKGFDAAHDDAHRSGEMVDAALAYTHAAASQARGETLEFVQGLVPAGVVRWPWEDALFKPSADPVRNLVKAGALIVAEIERLQRAAKQS